MPHHGARARQEKRPARTQLMLGARRTSRLLLLVVAIGLAAAFRAPLPRGAPSVVVRASPSRAAVPSLCSDAPENSDEVRDFLLAAAVERERFVTDEDVLRELVGVWVLLFNEGSGNEGIYSRRIPVQNGTAGFDIVVAFEDPDDAQRYAELLEATDFPSSTPAEMDTETLLGFCSDGGHTLGLVRRGVAVVPPQHAVEKFEWSPGVSEESTAELEGSMEQLDAQRKALEGMLGIGGPGDADDDDPGRGE